MLGKVIISDERGSSTLNTRNFERAGDKTSKTDGRIFRGVFLIVGGFVSFVNDDEAEIINRGEEGRARADDDLWAMENEQIFPDLVAGGFGLIRVDEGDVAAKSVLKNLDELGGKGDFWH